MQGIYPPYYAITLVSKSNIFKLWHQLRWFLDAGTNQLYNYVLSCVSSLWATLVVSVRPVQYIGQWFLHRQLLLYTLYLPSLQRWLLKPNLSSGERHPTYMCKLHLVLTILKLNFMHIVLEAVLSLWEKHFNSFLSVFFKVKSVVDFSE